MFARADVSICAHFGFHGGMALCMLIYSIMEGSTELDFDNMRILKTRFQKEIEEITAGNAWGSMDITEPGAGSDMANLKTVGEQDENGNWFVTGQKIFITSGHAKYHFVIARTEPNSGKTEGLNGLSQFMVPAYTENEKGEKVMLASFDRVEEKMGHNSSATVAVSFDKTPAYLLGKRGEGFRMMLLLMNNARIGVGFECIGLIESAIRMCKAYAAQRPSMGKTIDQHEMIADYIDEMETDQKAIRALSMEALYNEELAQKKKIKLLVLEEDTLEYKALEKEINEHKNRARMVTPLLKYYASEKAVEITRRNVQIHGGSGYMKEYGAEKLVRDAMVMPIYEGTSQIQALMAMKDNLGAIIKNPQDFISKKAQSKWLGLWANDPLERRVAKLRDIKFNTLQLIISRTAIGKFKELKDKPFNEWLPSLKKNWDPKHDFSFAMLHAERLIKILTDVAICNTLLRQSRKFPERTEILEAFLERAEPRCKFYYDEISTCGDRILKKLEQEPEEQVSNS